VWLWEHINEHLDSTEVGNFLSELAVSFSRRTTPMDFRHNAVNCILFLYYFTLVIHFKSSNNAHFVLTLFPTAFPSEHIHCPTFNSGFTSNPGVISLRSEDKNNF
jgi:hypothetical protein